jgi:hypothetical protein
MMLDAYAADDESPDECDRHGVALIPSAPAHDHDGGGGMVGTVDDSSISVVDDSGSSGGGTRVFLECAARHARMAGFDSDAAARVAVDFVLKWIGQGNVLFDAVSGLLRVGWCVLVWGFWCSALHHLFAKR